MYVFMHVMVVGYYIELNPVVVPAQLFDVYLVPLRHGEIIVIKGEKRGEYAAFI